MPVKVAFLVWLTLATVASARVDEVKIPAQMKTCEAAEDCVQVEILCSHCCHQGAVNKKAKADYQKLYQKSCRDYHGGACNCISMPHHLVCRKGLCEVEYDKVPSK